MRPSPPSPPDPDVPAACHSLMERSPVPMAELGGAGHLVRYVNPAFCRLTGKSKNRLVGKSYAEALPDSDGCAAVLDRVYRSGVAESHAEPERPGSHPAYWSYAVWPVLNDKQQPVGVMMQVTETTHFHRQAGAMNEALLISAVRQHERTELAENLSEQLQTEIAERKRGEQRQEMLLNELAHRGKNLLTVIQAIASRSLSGHQSLAEARESLIQRILALARSQTMLVKGAFEGAPLADILRLEIEAFSGRVEAGGPDVMLNPRATQTFALLAHELATNAIKHGALSQPRGRIAIHWSIDDKDGEPRFKFQWQERGGPPVVPPTRRGFGRILIEKATAQDFGAQPEIRYAPEGFSYEIDVPLSNVAATATGERRFLSPVLAPAEKR